MWYQEYTSSVCSPRNINISSVCHHTIKKTLMKAFFLTSNENNADVMCERVRWFAFSWQDALKVSLKSWVRLKSELQFQQPEHSEWSRPSAEGLHRNKTSQEAVSIMLGELLMCRNSLTGLWEPVTYTQTLSKGAYRGTFKSIASTPACTTLPPLSILCDTNQFKMHNHALSRRSRIQYHCSPKWL